MKTRPCLGQKKIIKIPTPSKISPSILGPCLGHTIFTDDNRTTLPCSGQIQILIRTDLLLIMPFSGQRGQKPYTVQWWGGGGGGGGAEVTG